MNMTDGVIKPLTDHVDRVKHVAVALIGVGAAPPLLNFIFGVGSPWPSGQVTAYFTTIVIWGVLLTCYSQTYKSRVAKARVRGWVIGFAVVACLSLLCYIMAWAFFVVPQTGTEGKIVCGYELLDEWKGKGISEFDLLRGNEWKPESVYTRFSLAVGRFAVLSSWLMLFSAIAGVTGITVGLLEGFAPGDLDR